MGETDFSFFFSFMHRGGAERGPFITVKSAPIDEGQSFDDAFRQPMWERVESFSNIHEQSKHYGIVC